MDQSSRLVVCPHCLTVNRVPAARPASQAKCGHCHRPMFEGKPAVASTEGFDRHRTSGDIPILVDLWAPWCGPCRAMAPAFERAAAQLEPDYRLLKVNIDEEPALAERYQVRGIPLLMLFAGGNPIAQNAGAMDTAGIVRWARAQVMTARPAQTPGTAA